MQTTKNNTIHMEDVYMLFRDFKRNCIDFARQNKIDTNKYHIKKECIVPTNRRTGCHVT